MKYNTASQEIPLGHFLDSTDGNTEETSLTIANTDIKIWKAGATTLANKNSGGATHISNGIYYATLDATDTDTVGPLVIFAHVSGALACKVNCIVYPAQIYDSLFAGTDLLQVDVSELSASVEGGHTLADIVRILLAVLAGKSSGGGTSTIAFRDHADSKDRVSVTVDSNGNRTAIGTFDGS